MNPHDSTLADQPGTDGRHAEHGQLVVPPVIDVWRADSLVHGVVLLLMLSAVQRAVGFLRAILFCRWLDADQLGLWDMAFAFLMLAGPLAVLALPGTFGRYAGYYRLHGQLRSFLRQTAAACVLLTLVAVAVIGLNSSWFSALIFGSPQQAGLVVLLALGLIAVVAHNSCISLAIALRNMRLAAMMEFLNGVLFAFLGVALLLSWRCKAESVVLAYSGSCLLSVIFAAWWILGSWKASPQNIQPLSKRRLWSKLIPFTAWILLINLLSNLFGIADRYMIIQYAPGSNNETLALVGDYHSSRVVPLLLVSLSSLLGSMLLPHLCHDWECGRRGLVTARLNLFLKLLAYALLAAAAAVLFIAPWLFGVAFQGKFAGGLAVLPWTSIYCVWLSVALVAQQYLWCAERGGLIGLALGAGLAVNIAVNLLLLPSLGLLAAALAATMANLVALALILYFSRLAGFAVHRGLWIILGVVPVLYFGPWATALVLLALAMGALRSNQLLSAEEKIQLLDGLKHYWNELSKWRDKWAVQN
jgi:PST family polysaccharide transporter